MSELKDYTRWKALGPGGLPVNVIGWAITKVLTPWGRDPLTVRDVTQSSSEWDLPVRRGPRPAVAPYPVPHRQADGLVAGDPISVSDVLENFAWAQPDRMFVSRSHFERRGDGLFVSEHYRRTPAVKKARGEIAHVHAGDGSLHVVAEHADAQRIIDAGWGELHPLAGRPVIGLPESYVLLYAPRDTEDVRHVTRILERVVETALAAEQR